MTFEIEGIIEDNKFPLIESRLKLRLSGCTGELNMVKPGDIGRPPRGLLHKDRSPEDMNRQVEGWANGLRATGNLLIM